MIPNLKQKPLVILLAVLTLGFFLHAAAAPAEPPVPEAVAKPAEPSLEKAKAKAQAAIDRAQAALDRTQAKTQAGIEKAQTELGKAQAKLGQAGDDKKQAKAQAALERAETALERAQDKAQAEIENAEQELEKALAKLEDESDKMQEVRDQAFAPHGGQEKPTVRVGQSIHVKTNETVHKLVVVLGDAVVDGTVEGDLVVVLGEARVNGKVKGNAVNVGKGLVLGPHAVIEGTAVGVLGGVERAEGAQVDGQVVPVKLGDLGDFKMPDWLQRTFTQCVLKARPLTFAVGWVWGAAAAFLLGYLLLAAVFSRPVEAVVQALDNRGVTAFLMGLVALPFTAFISVILAVTGVGVIVLPFLWAALFVAALFGKAAVVCHLGGALSRMFKVQFPLAVLLLFGAMVVSLFYVIPYVGLISWMVLTLWGLGAALLALFVGFRKERAAAVAAPASTQAPAVFASAPAPATVPVTESPVAHSAPADGGSLGFAAAPAASVPPDFTGNSPAPSAPAMVGVPEAIALPRVGFGRRFWATLLDWILLVFIVEGPVLNLSGRWNKVRCLLYLAYFIGFYVWRGTTLGGLVLGLKVVRLDGRKLDFACALVRSLGSVFSGVAGMLGWFWCAWDPERQTWHDKLAGTVVVRVEKVQPLV